MANYTDKNAGDVILAADLNALSDDTIDPTLGHDHEGTEGTKLSAANAFYAGVLAHERGGIGADISPIMTGDIIVGQSSGVAGLETAMSQAQAEAGTEHQVRGVTAERIKQAIAALGAVTMTIETFETAITGASTFNTGALSATPKVAFVFGWCATGAGSNPTMFMGFATGTVQEPNP